MLAAAPIPAARPAVPVTVDVDAFPGRVDIRIPIGGRDEVLSVPPSVANQFADLLRRAAVEATATGPAGVA